MNHAYSKLNKKRVFPVFLPLHRQSHDLF